MTPCGDNRYYSNQFLQKDVFKVCEGVGDPNVTEGNVFVEVPRIVEMSDGFYVELAGGAAAGAFAAPAEGKRLIKAWPKG